MGGGGPRVLIVEDEALIAMLLQMAATEAGYDVVGPVDSADEAALVAKAEHIDAAILDIHLRGGGLSYPVADILAERSIPFAFVTSQPPSTIVDVHACRPVLPKPVFGPELKELLAKLVRLSPPAVATAFGSLGTTGTDGAVEGYPPGPAV